MVGRNVTLLEVGTTVTLETFAKGVGVAVAVLVWLRIVGTMVVAFVGTAVLVPRPALKVIMSFFLVRFVPARIRVVPATTATVVVAKGRRIATAKINRGR